MFVVKPRGMLGRIVYTWAEVQDVFAVSMRLGRPCLVKRLG